MRIIGKYTPLPAHSYLGKFALQLDFGVACFEGCTDGCPRHDVGHAGHVDSAGGRGCEIFQAQLDLIIRRRVEVKFKVAVVLPTPSRIDADR